MRITTALSAIISVVFTGAIFGFFYAWICSTMWGLDNGDPRIAIAAMQAMNASVRNIVFAPAFFGTGPVLIVTALIKFKAGERFSGICFALAGAVYLIFAMGLTMAINVPMNEALALVSIPEDINAARLLWQDYSQPWQMWNVTRTIASGIALVLAALGAVRLSNA